MGLWGSMVRYFAEAASTAADAARTLADRGRSDAARRAQTPVVESLGDHLPDEGASVARAIFHDLTAALADPEAWVRATAARGLREMAGVFRAEVGDDVVAAAVTALLPAARGDEPEVRASAAAALAGLCDVARDVDKARIAATLAPLCDEPSATLRAEGAIGLGACGEVAAAFVPRLGELLGDPDERVRGNAAAALWMVGAPVEARHVERLTTLLALDPSPRVRADAASALGKVGRDAATQVVPLLVEATSDGTHDVRHFAVFALSDFGAAAVEAVPRLAEMLGLPEHREAAAIALRAVASTSARAELARHGLPLD